MPRDFIDLILHGLLPLPLGSQEFVNQPKRVAGSDPKHLIYDNTEDFVRGSVHYANARRKNDFRTALNFLIDTERTLAVEKISLQLQQLIYERLVIALPKSAGAPLLELVFGLYSEYARRPVNEIHALARVAIETMDNAWNVQCNAEEALTPDALKSFYESLEFPIACTFRKIASSNISVARTALPVILARQLNAKKAFDFGGNSGLLTTALAASGVQHCLLIDVSKPMLDFAQWRDRRMGLTNIDYLEFAPHGAASSPPQASFDFGICTEVLEHVYDVEAAVSYMAELLAKDGLLFQAASFGHCPYPTHLRRNLRYSGKEDELMSKFGLKRVEVKLPIPPRGNERIYRKIA